MIGTRTAAAARAAGVAMLAGAAALGLAVGTAHATPGPPRGEGTVYGNPWAAAPFWRYQGYDDDCVEMAVSDVVGELTGQQPSEQAIVKLAQTGKMPNELKQAAGAALVVLPWNEIKRTRSSCQVLPAHSNFLHWPIF